ncbi:hypothetical protein D9M72_540010 [compost metagenome]
MRRQLHDVEQAGALLLALLGLRVGLRHGNARHVGDLLHGLREAQAFEIGQEAKMVAGDAAAETMVPALAILAVEARRLLPMEGAAGPIVAARDIGLAPIPGDAFGDHVRNRHAIAYLVKKGL